MPHRFKKAYPSSGIITGGTETQMAKPSNARQQQATSSTYKNKNTVKILLGALPSGLINCHLSMVVQQVTARFLKEATHKINRKKDVPL